MHNYKKISPLIINMECEQMNHCLINVNRSTLIYNCYVLLDIILCYSMMNLLICINSFTFRDVDLCANHCWCVNVSKSYEINAIIMQPFSQHWINIKSTFHFYRAVYVYKSTHNLQCTSFLSAPIICKWTVIQKNKCNIFLSMYALSLFFRFLDT